MKKAPGCEPGAGKSQGMHVVRTIPFCPLPVPLSIGVVA